MVKTLFINPSSINQKCFRWKFAYPVSLIILGGDDESDDLFVFCKKDFQNEILR